MLTNAMTRIERNEMHVFVFFCFGKTPSDNQWLFLALCSKIAPDKLKGPYGIPGIELRLAAFKAKLSLQPEHTVYQLLHVDRITGIIMGL